MYYVEKYYPHVLSCVISIIFFQIAQRSDNIEEIAKKIMDTSLAISGTLLGFLLTILTIINSIETRRMRFIKESGNYKTLLRYLKTALLSNIFCISVCFITPILISLKTFSDYTNLIYSVTIFIVAFTWLANIRFSGIFIRLLSDPKK